MRLWRHLLYTASVLCLIQPSIAKDPKVAKTSFKNPPSLFFYFEDSPVILSHDADGKNVWRSEDDGETWKVVDTVPEKVAVDLWQHPFNKKYAYIVTDSEKQWKSEDQGKTWQSYKVPVRPSFKQQAFEFHAKKDRFLLFAGRKCEGSSTYGCKEVMYYTKDNFDTDPKLLMEETHGCIFAQSTQIFDKGSPSTVLCVVGSKKDPTDSDLRRLITSDEWFEEGSQKEPNLDGSRPYTGIAGITSVQKFLVAAVKSAGTDEMLLFVSDDAVTWDKAQFPSDQSRLKKGAYTILESTPHSLQVDVLTGHKLQPMGTLFTSNSNGTYFTKNVENTNRNSKGLVDFEKIKDIQGIILANKIDNAKAISSDPRTSKVIKSVISFDDGRTWKSIKDKDGDEIHLHSVTDLTNAGRVFSSQAPGIAMGVGNRGASLLPYDEGTLYVSDDAGVTWKSAKKGAHKYEFGDSGAILVAIEDVGYTDKVIYSLNHGKDWKEMDLGIKIRAKLLTTTPDSTSTKFTLVGTAKSSDKRDTGPHYVFMLDFSPVYDGKECKKDDFEKWYARVDDKGEPDCLMGHKQYYMRRKANAECSVGNLYKETQPENENCPCTREDYECDFNFVLEDGKCVPAKGFTSPVGQCKKPSDKYKGSTGYRLIPGNTCNKEKGEKLDGETERECGNTPTAPTDGKVKHSTEELRTRGILEYYYLEPTENDKEEVIIMRTAEHVVYRTEDHGKTWKKILEDIEVVAVYPHRYSQKIVYFVTPTKAVHYTTDRGKTFSKFEAPTKPNHEQLQIMDFHPKEHDYLIWTGSKDCDNFASLSSCHIVSYYSKDGGENWNTLLSWVRNCQWVPNQLDEQNPGHRIYCEKFAKEDGKSKTLDLVASDNYYQSQSKPFSDITRFALMNEFILVASINEDGSSLQLDASIDGQTFAHAKFPSNFPVEHQQGYTVLDSSTHSVFLHVTVSQRLGSEFGTLLKSNSNGTSYVTSLSYVNRDEKGYVDFEKMQGLEGVAMVNVVTNPKQNVDGSLKKLKSKITHNDGGEWAYITPPKKDSDGKSYDCGSDNLEKCSLNLHGYTERKDPRDTYSSSSGIGLMMGIGNVGEHLGAHSEANTFITGDGGITWKEVKKGVFQWEYGDHGSIIVIVSDKVMTNTVYYTLDEGRKWESYQFADETVEVVDISTLASDTSRKFLLWTRPRSSGQKFEIVQLDFTGLTDQICKIDPSGKDDPDFDIWSPKHPAQPNGCLFGHQEQYRRKKTDHLCYIGSKLPQPLSSGRQDNCSCSRQDYECDFNYERQNDGSCKLVPGLQKPDHEAACRKDKNLITWWEPTGYRRIPLTTCAGGKELDKVKSHTCPGKEALRDKQGGGGLGGFGIFFIVIVSMGMAGALGWIIWQRWQGQFGQIRLGDEGSFMGGGGGRGQSPFIKYPVVAVSAVIAIVSAIPVILASIYGVIAARLQRRPRYTSRGQFARGDYASVTHDDEGELLGDDSDEDV